MKQPINEIKRMQQLAGVVNEEFQSGTEEIDGMYKFNGKTFDEWRDIFKNLPYEDMMQAAELHQSFKMYDMLRAMKKYSKYM